MTTTINGSSPSITFSDATTQTTAFTTGAVTQATMGTNVAGTGPAFRAYLGANQTITSSTFTKVQLNTEDFDTNNNFDNATNYRFTPTVAGTYIFTWAMSSFSSTTPTRGLSALYKNGLAALGAYGSDFPVASGVGTSTGSVVIQMNGTTDYVELYAYISAVTAVVSTTGGTVPTYTYLTGCLVRGA